MVCKNQQKSTEFDQEQTNLQKCEHFLTFKTILKFASVYVMYNNPLSPESFFRRITALDPRVVEWALHRQSM
jgi:hypothetical protein